MSYILARGMHVFALTRNGGLVQAVVKEVVDEQRAHLFFPRLAGVKMEDAILAAKWLAHPDEPIAIVRTLWNETSERPLRFRIDRTDYPEFHRAAERWPYDALLYESGRKTLFEGPVSVPIYSQPAISLPSKSVQLDLPRRPTRHYDDGLAFQKRNRNFFSRF